MSNEKPESLIGRWSRLKQRAREAPEAEEIRQGEPPDGGEARDGKSAAGEGRQIEGEGREHDRAEGAAGTGTPKRSEASGMLTDEDFADVDFDALDFQSDYTRFMGRNVPDSVRNRALSKLWSSNPVLANLDGLDDYLDDYTDAAVAVAPGTLKTAYKIGQGFLSDEEAAEWDRLGKPEPDLEPEVADAGAAAAEAGREAQADAGGAMGAEKGAGAGMTAGSLAPVVTAAAAADAWHGMHLPGAVSGAAGKADGSGVFDEAASADVQPSG